MGIVPFYDVMNSEVVTTIKNETIDASNKKHSTDLVLGEPRKTSSVIINAIMHPIASSIMIRY